MKQWQFYMLMMNLNLILANIAKVWYAALFWLIAAVVYMCISISVMRKGI